MAETLEEDIQRIIEERSNLWMWMSLLASAYSFEQALALLVRATDDMAYGVQHKRTHPRRTLRHEFLIHLKAIMFSVGLVLAIIFSLGLTAFGKILLQWASQIFVFPQITVDGWSFFVYGLPFLVLILYLTIFYRAAPKSYTPRLTHAVVTFQNKIDAVRKTRRRLHLKGR